MGTAVLGEKTKKFKIAAKWLENYKNFKLNVKFTCSRQIFFEILLQPNGLRTKFPLRTCTMGTAALGVIFYIVIIPIEPYLTYQDLHLS
jgi:hypothetical protein